MKSLNKRRYILAFIITSAIFLLGFFFGFYMDVNRVNYFENLNEENKMNIRSMQLQYELLKSDNFENQCGAVRFMFNKFIVELENNRERLETYTKQADIKKEEFNLMKREYTLSQINFWYIAQNLKKTCPQETDVVTILYFYSDEKKCTECADQAVVLNYYKMKMKENLLVFAIDEQFESNEPLIKLFKQTYGIESYPTIIVNGKDSYSKYVGKDEFAQIFCNNYSSAATKSIVCENQ